MFLHGGWMHLISNMWALFIFRRQHRRQARAFWLSLLLPCLRCLRRADSSIYVADQRHSDGGCLRCDCGVLGGYIISYPTARVLTAIPIFFIIRLIEVPAAVYLGFWFISQAFTGFASIAKEPGEEGGIAWWAHIGGFIAGAVLIKIMSFRRQSSSQTLDYTDN